MNLRYVLALFTVCWFSAASAQRPVMLTETASPLGIRHLQTGIGVEYLEKHQAPARDLAEKEIRVFMASMNFGVAENVDFNLEWRGGLVATFPSGHKGYDWGDLTVATKITIVENPESFPNIGIRSAVKLPNTSYLPHKLGSDQTDFFFQALLSGYSGGFEGRLNLGFGIVGVPASTGIQNDVFTLNVAGVFPIGSGTSMFLEANGVKGYFGGDGKLVTRAGITTPWEGVEWSLFGSLRVLGDNRDFGGAFEMSENWSIGVYLKKDVWW